MSASRRRSLRNFLILVVVSAIALQLYFLLRIVGMTVVDPQSTTFQRAPPRSLPRTRGRRRRRRSSAARPSPSSLRRTCS